MSGVNGSSGPVSPGWKVSILGGLTAALIFLAIWTPLHSVRSQPPLSDLFTHLSVSRHLCQGEGFLTDMAYPLSFAFPFSILREIDME